jgi:DnaK suppressor protein
VDHRDSERVEARIALERTEAARLVEALSAELDGIIESELDSNNDDEHDPDGATTGYERAKTTAMLDRARQRVVEADQAAERVRSGTYRQCDVCGGDIGSERLEALIATTRCRSCAATSTRG